MQRPTWEGISARDKNRIGGRWRWLRAGGQHAAPPSGGIGARAGCARRARFKERRRAIKKRHRSTIPYEKTQSKGATWPLNSSFGCSSLSFGRSVGRSVLSFLLCPVCFDGSFASARLLLLHCLERPTHVHPTPTHTPVRPSSTALALSLAPPSRSCTRACVSSSHNTHTPPRPRPR